MTGKEINENLIAVKGGFLAVKENYKKGMTSDELFSLFISGVNSVTRDYEIVYDFICGEDSVKIEGKSLDKTLKDGDTVIIDVSLKLNGTWCDVTRTFFIGEPKKAQVEMFGLVKRSLDCAEKELKIGVKASKIYDSANYVYNEKGYSLVHHAGHKIGGEPVIDPEFVSDENGVIDSGFYAIESGCYQDFGIRLENDYFVDENGAKDLFGNLLPLDIKEYILK